MRVLLYLLLVCSIPQIHSPSVGLISSGLFDLLLFCPPPPPCTSSFLYYPSPPPPPPPPLPPSGQCSESSRCVCPLRLSENGKISNAITTSLSASSFLPGRDFPLGLSLDHPPLSRLTHLPVRVQASWALANLTDTLPPSFPSPLLVSLHEAIVKASTDNDKVKCNAVRAAGNVLKDLQEQGQLTHAAWIRVKWLVTIYYQIFWNIIQLCSYSQLTTTTAYFCYIF